MQPSNATHAINEHDVCHQQPRQDGSDSLPLPPHGTQTQAGLHQGHSPPKCSVCSCVNLPSSSAKAFAPSTPSLFPACRHTTAPRQPTHANRQTRHTQSSSAKVCHTCSQCTKQNAVPCHPTTQHTNTGGGASRSLTLQMKRLQLRQLDQLGRQRLCSLCAKLVVCLQSRHSHTPATNDIDACHTVGRRVTSH